MCIWCLRLPGWSCYAVPSLCTSCCGTVGAAGAEHRACSPYTQLLCACFPAAVSLGYSSSLFFALLPPHYAVRAKPPYSTAPFPLAQGHKEHALDPLQPSFRYAGVGWPALSQCQPCNLRSSSAGTSCRQEGRAGVSPSPLQEPDQLTACGLRTDAAALGPGATLGTSRSAVQWFLSPVGCTLYYIVRFGHLTP